MQRDILSDEYISGEQFEKHLNEINKLSNINELFSDYEKMSETLNHLEKADLILRRKMNDITPVKEIHLNSKYPEILNTPVKLDVDMQTPKIQISMPLTLERDKAESWYLSVLLDNALSEYEQAHGSLFFIISPPVCLMVKRKDIRAKKSYRDNDNFEMTKAVNVIFRHLGFADSPDNMTYISAFETADDIEDIGTDITVAKNLNIEKNTKAGGKNAGI